MSQCDQVINPGTPKEARCSQPCFVGLIAGSMWRSNYCSVHEPQVVNARKIEHAYQVKLKRKLEATRIETKQYVERGGISPLNIPVEIINASEQVGAWFAAQGLIEWKLGPCASRRLCDTHEEQLVDLVVMLRTIQHAVGGFLK